MNNQIDIIQKSIEETALFLKNSNHQKLFTSIVEKYTQIHNKGIFVDFSFNSNDAIALFSHYVTRHNLSEDLVKHVNPVFSRNKKLKFHNVNLKLEKNIRELRSVKDSWKKTLQRFEERARYYLPDKGYIEANFDEQFIVSAFKEKQIDKLGKGLLMAEHQALVLSINKQSSLKELVYNLENQNRSISNEIEETEVLIFKLALKKYMKSLERKLKSMFHSPSLQIKYSQKDWVESYYKEKRNHYFETYKDSSLSVFECFLMTFIMDNQKKFTIYLHDNDFKYQISRDSLSISYKDNLFAQVDDKYNNWQQRLSSFYSENEEFALTIQTLNEVNHSFSKETSTSYLLTKYLFTHFSEDIINEYNYLINGLSKAKEERNKPVPSVHSLQLPTIQEAFPNLKFTQIQKQDMAYWYALKEEKFNDVVKSISDNSYTLIFQD